MIPGDPLLKGQQLHSNPSLGKSVEDLFADIFWGISMPLEWLFWYTNMFLVITSDNSQGISALHCSFPHLTFLAWESTQNQLPRLWVKCRFTGIAEESGHPYVTASSSICFIRREKVTASFVCRTLLLFRSQNNRFIIVVIRASDKRLTAAVAAGGAGCDNVHRWPQT